MTYKTNVVDEMDAVEQPDAPVDYTGNNGRGTSYDEPAPKLNTAALDALITARHQATEAVERAARAKDEANRAHQAAALTLGAIAQAIAHIKRCTGQ